MAVKSKGDNYKYLLDKFKAERKFQLAAFISEPFQIHSFPKEVLNDLEFFIEACKENKNCINYVKDETLKKKIEEALSELEKSKPQTFDDLIF